MYWVFLKKNGGEILVEISKRKIGGVGVITSIYVREPEENLIEMQNGRYRRKEKHSKMMGYS